MKKLTFGQAQSMADKAAMATKKGYDSGKPSTGAAKPITTVKPKIGAKKIGATVQMKW